MVIRKKFTREDIYSLLVTVIDRNATTFNDVICEVAKIQEVLAEILNDLYKEINNGE